MRFSKRNCIFFVFFMLETDKQKKGKQQIGKRQKNYKIVFFEGGHSKMENERNGFFVCKNCLTLFVSGREKKRVFLCTLSPLAKNIIWTKTVTTRKNYKNSGFSGIVQNLK